MLSRYRVHSSRVPSLDRMVCLQRLRQTVNRNIYVVQHVAKRMITTDTASVKTPSSASGSALGQKLGKQHASSRQISNMSTKLDSSFSPKSTNMITATDTKYYSNEHYIHQLEHTLQTGGIDAVEKLYCELRPMIFTKERLPLLGVVCNAVTTAGPSCAVRIPRMILQDLLKEDEDKPWLRKFYPNLIFTLINLKAKCSLDLYKIVRKKVSTIGRMRYIRIFGWIFIQSTRDLGLVELLYEDFVKNDYHLNPGTYTRLFSELLKKRLDELCHNGDAIAKRRADLLYQLYCRQAMSNAFPIPHLTSI
jgi:hypothetical protein